MSEWRPAEAKSRYDSRRPEVGDVVGWEWRAWEVTHIAEAEPTPTEADRLALYTEPFRAGLRPYKVSLRRVHGAPHDRENSRQEIALRCPVRSSSFPIYPHGRVPLCSCHGHPWPCIEAEQEKYAEGQMKRAERELRLLPGCCPGCQEPVTSRQRSIVFPGPYVRNPLAAANPVFHLRRKCWGAAARYEDDWVKADPTAPRSLLTLRCEGGLIVHADGSAECHGAPESDCPTVYARHRSMMACYLQSHGCPQECPPGRHGTRLSGHPADPRAITKVGAA